MQNQFPSVHILEDSQWNGYLYKEKLQAVLRYAGNFVLIDPEVKDLIFMFLANDLLSQDLIINLKNRVFRNFYRDILDYLYEEFEDIIESEDVFNTYMDLRTALFDLRYSPQLDPEEKFPMLLADSTGRHLWNNFGITPEVIADFSEGNFYDYDEEVLDKFRDLIKWLLLDVLNYFDTLDKVLD